MHNYNIVKGVTEFLCSIKEVLGRGKCLVGDDTDLEIFLNLSE